VISLRPIRAEDLEFLCEVYAGTRAEELAIVPWNDAQKAAFIAQQFTAQHDTYQQRYVDKRFSIIEDDGVPIGRLYLAFLPGELRVVDIALLPAHRERGIGSRLMADVIEEADQRGVMVSLHVEHWNPARALYERLGFTPAGADDVYLRMERPVRQLNTAS
jgi:ribosomal protein S18 acetylase RimI-like enzyme